MNWTLGYNTNGFAHHRLADAIDIVADIGYGAVAITLDHHALNPFSATLDADLERVRSQLRRRNLRCVIETGARFLLDPRRKHRPTLVSAAPKDRARRAEFICHAVDIARRLDADAVSFWSGALDAPGDHDAFDRLICGCQHCLEHAATRGVRLAFEP